MAPKYQEYHDRWLAHIRALSEDIGPRGSTTDGERRGAEYCAGVFAGLGLSPQTETFPSASSIFLPHLLGSAAFLVAFVLYPLAGRASAAAAALLSLVALASELLELGFVDNPLRWIVPKGRSQNVVATLPPAGEHHRDLVLIGHVDSQRTPLIFKSQAWVSAYQAFTTAAFVLFVAQTLLYGLGTFTQWGWIWPLTILSALGAILLAALCIQADRTPYTNGANDNASGAGLVLALAQHFQAEPLQHTRLWLACTGSEEVQHYGAIDFFRRYRSQLKDPRALVFEMLGCAGPAWQTREGIIVPFHADRELVALAERLAHEHPEWGAYPTFIKGGNTEMADALRQHIPAIALVGNDRQHNLPNWHQVGDTFDKISPEVTGRAYAFAWTFIRALDE
jgi:hypothetical protein